MILYLPPGPLFQPDETDNHYTISDDNALSEYIEDINALSPQHILASTTLSTVVTVNYRLGRQRVQTETTSAGEPQNPGLPVSRFYKYPTPIHDTLAGFDWILQNLRPSQLCVFGRHVGGSLAVMLALTEPRSIRAIAAYEPVCDWVGLDEYCISLPDDTDTNVSVGDKEGKDSNVSEPNKKALAKKTKRHVAPLDLVPLLKAREKFFHKPDNYFDAFASPILFLRSAGRDVPETFPKYLTGPDYPVPVSVHQEEEEDLIDFWDIHTSPDEESTTPPVSGPEVDPTAGMKPIRRRKALSRWPPYGLDYGLSADSWTSHRVRRLQVTLPWVRLFVPGKHVTEPEEVIVDFEGPCLEDEPDQEKQGRKTRRRRRPAGAEDTVLEIQATEMVSVMHRACFFGQEKGFGQNRVKLVRVPAQGISPSADSSTPVWWNETVEEEAGRWLHSILNSSQRE